jgi:hypothetical protein
MKPSECRVKSRKYLKRGQAHANNPRSAVRPRSYHPLFEILEERLALSAVWINPAGGDWDTASNWSGATGPGGLPWPNDDVVINSLQSGASITHALNTSDAVNSVTAAAPITLSNGTLSVAGDFSDSSPVTLSGGTLANASVQAATTVQGSGTVSGLTLAGTLNANAFGGSLTITDLTLASGLLETTNVASLNFNGTQTLTGTGEVLFNGGNNHNNRLNVEGSGSVLTIGPNITIDGLGATINAGSGVIDNFGTLSVGSSGGTQSAALSGGTFSIDGAWTNETGATMQAVNDGNLILNAVGGNDEGYVVPSGVWTNDAGAAISVTGNSDGGGSLTLQGNGWSNAGTITMNNSNVYLGGTFTLAALGNLSRTGGTVNLTGTLNNTGTTLALNGTTGSWLLDGGTINGGTVTTLDTVLGTTSATSTLNGPLTLVGTLDESDGASVTIVADSKGNGLTLVPGLVETLVETTSIASLNFSGTQTLAGTGEVLFNGGNNHNNRLNVEGNSVLTIGPNITIDGLSATLNVGSGTIDNFGTLSVGSSGGTQSAALSGGTFTIDGAWTNEPGATIQVVNDANLILNAMGGNDEGNVVPSGVWTNDAGATISVTGNDDGGGSLSLEGNGWSNAGNISMTNSSVFLGGTFTIAALGNLSRTGGTLRREPEIK